MLDLSYKKLLALSVLSAMTFNMGCGDTGRKSAPTRRGAAPTPDKPNKAGKPDPNAATKNGPDGKPIPDTAAGAKKSEELKRIEDEEKKFQIGERQTKEKLADGSYKLMSVTTGFYFIKGGEELRVLHTGDVKPQGKGFIISLDSKPQGEGTMSNDIDDGRTISIPQSFHKVGDWKVSTDSVNTRTQILLNQVKTPPNTVISKFVDATASITHPSVLEILDSVGPQAVLAKDDFAYQGQDSKGTPIFVRLLKANENTLIIFIAIDEKGETKSGNKQQGSNITRNLYLSYQRSDITPPPSTTAPAP